MNDRLPRLLALLCAMAAPALLHAQSQYNLYFGDIHSQSWYSDGNKEQNTSTYLAPVAKAIVYARDVAVNMDFLGVSDHNHNEGLNMTLARWRAGHAEADSVNQDGVFVGLYGQEWGTISQGGHALVYGTTKLFGWNTGVYDVYVAKGDYPRMFDSLKKYNGFCYLAHPQQGDYSSIFTSASYNANWDSVVMGIALKNGPALDQVYNESDPASGNYESRYHDLLAKGYHIAPCGNQDNHYTNFGMLNQQRTVVLATSLSKANILDGLRSRRAYATEDHNLQVRFESGTHVMGELFSRSGSVPLRVKVTEPDGQNLISKIEIRYGVPGSGSAPTLLASVSNKDSLVISQAQTTGTTYYYYAYVQESNGRQAWIAPMWVTVTSASGPQSFSFTSPANGAANQPLSGTLSWQSSVNATTYDVYLDQSNPPTTLVSADQAGTTYGYSGLSNSGVYYWKVVAKNGSGTMDADGSPWSFTAIAAAPAAFSLTSPANSSANQSQSGTLSWESSANATSYDVYLDGNNPPTTQVGFDIAGTTYNYSGLSFSATYFWKVVAKNAAADVDATGSPWSFTTIENNMPGTFMLSSPASNATGQPLSGTLAWDSSSNATGYNIYLGTSIPPGTLLDSNVHQTSAPYTGLNPSMDYYWKVVAINVNGTTIASNSPRKFTTAAYPAAPTAPSAEAAGTSGIDLNWTDAATNETGYRVYRSDSPAGPFAQTGSNLPAGAASFSDTGLDTDTRYYYRIVAFNGFGEGNYVPVDRATLAVVPGAPSLSSVSYVTMMVVLDPATNPASTTFAIRAANETSVRYAQADGSMGPVPVWRTYDEWGGPGGIGVSGLKSCSAETLSAAARNGDAIETSSGPGASEMMLCFSLDGAVDPGWNLVSLPVLTSEAEPSAVFPTGVTGAFGYQGGYSQTPVLQNGSGYWMKFDASSPVTMNGGPILSIAIDVRKGWNIIGSVVDAVGTISIVQQPDDIVLSPYFEYDNGYTIADSIRPMQGYWVKSRIEGQLTLTVPSATPRAAIRTPGPAAGMNWIDITDRNSRHQRLFFSRRIGEGAGAFELPPLPPSGSFDARYPSQRFAEAIPEGSMQQIDIQGAAYPVTVAWRVGKGEGVAYKLSGKGVSVQLAPGTGSVKVQEPEGILRLSAARGEGADLPAEFSLRQNYPNPFNPSTEIKYDVPEESEVRLSVFNVLGVEVATLVDGRVAAGTHSLEWTPKEPSGVYFIRLDARGSGAAGSFHQTRRALLLK